MSSQIRPLDTLACCWNVKQPTNQRKRGEGGAPRSGALGQGQQRSGKSTWKGSIFLCWLLDVPASVFQGRICSDKCTCCHTKTEAADQTFCLSQSQLFWKCLIRTCPGCFGSRCTSVIVFPPTLSSLLLTPSVALRGQPAPLTTKESVGLCSSKSEDVVRRRGHSACAGRRAAAAAAAADEGESVGVC